LVATANTKSNTKSKKNESSSGEDEKENEVASGAKDGAKASAPKAKVLSQISQRQICPSNGQSLKSPPP